MLIYNSWDTQHKTPFGAVTTGSSYQITVSVDWADKVIIHTFWEMDASSITMIPFEGHYYVMLTAPEEIGLLFYRFEVIHNGQSKFYGPSELTGGPAKETSNNAPCYQLTVHNPMTIPNWFSTGIMYQIYVDRFYKGKNDNASNFVRKNAVKHLSWDDKPFYVRDDSGKIVTWDFFGGNLKGVEEKLDYLSSLGVSIIYLNPIFDSVSNHKYDTGDYKTIDPMYGDDEIFEQFISEAKKRNITVMLDGVFSHTGHDSLYFNKYGSYDSLGAYQSQDSPYYSWYHFKQYPNSYDSWWGIDDLPNVNELDPSYIDYLLGDGGAIEKWMKAGIGGWRLDVADELPDEFIKKLKCTVRKHNKDAVLLGEVWEDASNKLSYGKRRDYIFGDALDSVTNYPLRNALIEYLLGNYSGIHLSKVIMRLNENYPQPVFMSLMNMTSTHDTTRLFTLLGDAPAPNTLTTWEKRNFQLSQEHVSLAEQRLTLFLITQFTLPGIPCIYYGDEVCAQGYEDPYNRGTYPWNTTINFHRNLIQSLSTLRNENTALSSGFFSFISYTADIFCFKRENENQTIFVYINRSLTQTYHLISDFSCHTLFSHANATHKNSDINLPPLSALVLS